MPYKVVNSTGMSQYIGNYGFQPGNTFVPDLPVTVLKTIIVTLGLEYEEIDEIPLPSRSVPSHRKRQNDALLEVSLDDEEALSGSKDPVGLVETNSLSATEAEVFIASIERDEKELLEALVVNGRTKTHKAAAKKRLDELFSSIPTDEESDEEDGEGDGDSQESDD
jgi:hypothetical protein